MKFIQWEDYTININNITYVTGLYMKENWWEFMVYFVDQKHIVFTKKLKEDVEKAHRSFINKMLIFDA